MYRWTDPTEPEGTARRPEPPPAEGPAWLTDRPEPRSAYLFGDEPEQPQAPFGNEPDQPGAGGPASPTGGFRAGTPDSRWPAGPADAWRTDGRHDRWQPGPADADPAGAPESGWRPGDGGQPTPTGTWPASAGPGDEHPAASWPAEERPTDDWCPVTEASRAELGRHRRHRRRRRPLMVGGAAAAATLVVGLGVAALALPGHDGRTEPTTADGVVAAAPGAAGDAPGDALAPASPTTTPSAAPSSARPSPTRSVTPKASRSTAPSRQLQRTATPSSTTTRSTPTTSGLSAELQQVVDLVNERRAKAGCKALTVDDKLMLAAQRHSQDQADHKTMTHDGSDGSDVGDRLDRVGYAWRAYGENVAWNQQSPAAVMDAWMNSPGHRANILNCSFTEIGVGVARSNGPYWTQDFGTPR
ncbi:CAP domain-containing protein [Micromonospora sp. NPDC007271]|uniref:CAP domain-containing protein n=1 Tax=Micromonospora sp. NPDC007271 TaxID=3154587 RepID=UPI0033C1A86F